MKCVNLLALLEVAELGARGQTVTADWSTPGECNCGEKSVDTNGAPLPGEADQSCIVNPEERKKGIERKDAATCRKNPGSSRTEPVCCLKESAKRFDNGGDKFDNDNQKFFGTHIKIGCITWSDLVGDDWLLEINCTEHDILTRENRIPKFQDHWYQCCCSSCDHATEGNREQTEYFLNDIFFFNT